MSKISKEVSKELFGKIIIEYRDNNMSLRQIQEKYRVNRQVVSKMLEDCGVKTTKGNHYRKYFHDFNYFETIDTHEKAYWLGFIMADGYIGKMKGLGNGTDRVGLTLDIKDIETLELFKKAISATNPIKIYKDKTQQDWIDKGYNKESTSCRILLSSQKTVDDLIDKGVIYNKSLTKEFPSKDKLPREFIYSYLRGYMDGNGYIYIKENKTQINSAYLSFSSSESFVKSLAQFGEGRVAKDNRSNGWSVFFNKKNSEVLLDKIYKHSTEETRMARKYKKYKECKNDE